MHTETCPACGNTHFTSLIDLGDLPRSGALLPSPGTPVSRQRLRFAYCLGCGLIRQPETSVTQPDYTHVDRGTHRQLPRYAAQIIDHLRANIAHPRDELIVEVGANDGTFLDLLRESGFERRLGVEPSLHLCTRARSKGHDIENLHLSSHSAGAVLQRHGTAAAVICRHTLEHVPQPAVLLRAMSALLRKDGVLFIEVPSVAPIVERLHGHELWDEHISVFSADNLKRMVLRQGLTVDSVTSQPHRDGVNLLLWARNHPGAAQSTDQTHALTAACARFDARWKDLSRRLLQASAHWPAPVYAMGASHPQSNFLLYTGLGARVDALIDDDEDKLNRFVPLPQPTPVISSTRVIEQGATNGTLLLTAFGYPGWTQKMHDTLSSRGFLSIDPLAPAAVDTMTEITA